MVEEIISKAREGDFDRNRIPRLFQRVRCKNCGALGEKYIDYLKNGKFVIGSPQEVSVIQMMSYYSYLETERVTPIYVMVKCEQCGHDNKITDPILTLEYLREVTEFTEAPRTFYV